MLTYTIFAGVNGVGKTSMYKSIYYDINKDEKRINTDEMVAEIGSWKDNNLQIKCAREAVKLINYYMDNGISFNQETTLCGKSIIKNLRKAKLCGFYIVMNYIGVDTPQIAKERVAARVLQGGHGIPDEIIERRYYESLENFKDILSICDEVNIYDNTEKFKRITVVDNGIIRWKRDIATEWNKNIFK